MLQEMSSFVVLFALALCVVNGETPPTEGKKGEEDFVEKQYGVRYADTCEVCKYLVTELDAELQLTGRCSR